MALAISIRSPKSWVITGEFKQRLLELRTLERIAGNQVVLRFHAFGGELQVGDLSFNLGMQGLHDQSLGLGRADFGAGAAAEAVFSIHLNAELEALEFLADGVLGDKRIRSAGKFFFGSQNRADGRVRANEGTLAALDAVFGNPFGNVHRHTALFISGGAERNKAVGLKGGHGQLVTLLGEDRTDHVMFTTLSPLRP